MNQSINPISLACRLAAHQRQDQNWLAELSADCYLFEGTSERSARVGRGRVLTRCRLSVSLPWRMPDPSSSRRASLPTDASRRTSLPPPARKKKDTAGRQAGSLVERESSIHPSVPGSASTASTRRARRWPATKYNTKRPIFRMGPSSPLFEL